MTPFYERNGITIYCGDWIKIDISDNVDLVLTDPPYGIDVTKMTLGNGRKRVYRGGDWDSSPPGRTELNRLLAISRNQIFWGGNYFSNNLPSVRGWLVWNKHTGKNGYADCELAWSSLDTVVKQFDLAWVGANAKDTHKRYHPTQKPVALMEWCINLANTTGLVFDPYMGSGTTLVAAQKCGLSAIGVEVDEEYCKMAVERLRQTTLFSIPRTDNKQLYPNCYPSAPSQLSLIDGEEAD